MDINNLITQHRKSVGLSFSDIGFKRQVNVDTITLATALYGDTFLNALLNRIEQEPEPYYNYDGDNGSTPAPTFGNVQNLPSVTVYSKAKRTKAQKKEAAIDTISKIANVFAGVYGSYQKGKGAVGSNIPVLVNEEDKAHKKNIIILVASLLLIVILIIILSIKKTK